MSKDYIEGMRQRYTNPFRFYLTVSIVFFLIVGLSKTIDRFESLNNGDIDKQNIDLVEVVEKGAEGLNDSMNQLTPEQIDSISKVLDEDLQGTFIPETIREDIVKEVKKGGNDSIRNKGNFSFDFGQTRLTEFTDYQRKYPDSGIDQALDSLKYEKNFMNRFLYTKAVNANKLAKNADSREEFVSQLLSIGSIALFIFLPFFTLFLKFFYIRRSYTYIEHLIFVFHVQTVFFMLFSIYYLMEIAGFTPVLSIFTILFLLYLFLAMKKFYQQGFFKTAFKFLLLNFSYSMMGVIGIIIVTLISFALY